MRLRHLVGSIAVLLLALSAHAQQLQFLLTTTSPSSAQDICSNHGLNFMATAWSDYSVNRGVYLVSAPAGATAASVQLSLSTDTSVFGVEQVQPAVVPELAGATVAQSTTGLVDTSFNSQLVNFFGALVPTLYNVQPATMLIHSNYARTQTGLSGAGLTVAVIDTGIDPSHPVFASVLVPGFDFTRNIAGSGSEMPDLDPDTAAVISQSTTGLVDGLHLVKVSSFGVAVLAQSTTGLVDGSSLSAFGHGTMTAGLVHLVAPAARIMPLKAFHSDGTSDTFNIVRAIYYAAENGVNIISMSFEIPQSSPALEAAIHYAQSKGIALVAAAGNDGSQTQVFPAAIPNVIGIGSTSLNDVKSSFSNFGSPDVFFAAPGEGVITSYPGGHYAAGWGTSFSAPMVAGSVALILQHNFQVNACGFSNLINPLSRAVQVQQMGHGRIDLAQAINNFGSSGSGGNKCTGVVYSSSSSDDGDDD
jgi:subtilisin family serine protease